MLIKHIYCNWPFELFACHSLVNLLQWFVTFVHELSEQDHVIVCQGLCGLLGSFDFRHGMSCSSISIGIKKMLIILTIDNWTKNTQTRVFKKIVKEEKPVWQSIPSSSSSVTSRNEGLLSNFAACMQLLRLLAYSLSPSSCFTLEFVTRISIFGSINGYSLLSNDLCK